MGIPGDIPLAGDWDGDGTDTFSVYRPSEGKVYINNLNTTTVAQDEYFFGVPGDKPFVIDFDGDGIDDVGLHREATGLVYMTDARTGGIRDGAVAGTDLQFFWGIANDAVFAGDWIGSGIDAPGLVRPNEARTFLRYANTEGFADEDWPIELAGWLPVVGRIPGAPHRFDIELSPSEVVPGPGATGAGGAATLTLASGGQACVSLTLNGITSLTAVHLHEAGSGSAGPMSLDLGISGGLTFGCVAGDDGAARAVLDRPEDFYLQVHTSTHPDGALRGQVAERRTWDVSLVGAEVIGAGDADGFVTLGLDVSTTGRICLTDFEAQRISTITSIGLYRAVEDEVGPLIVDLTLDPSRAGCVVAPGGDTARVLATPLEHYLQINTVQFPSGAVRAQLTNGG